MMYRDMHVVNSEYFDLMGFNNLFRWTTSCSDDCWYQHPRLNKLQICDNIVFFPVL